MYLYILVPIFWYFWYFSINVWVFRKDANQNWDCTQNYVASEAKIAHKQTRKDYNRKQKSVAETNKNGTRSMTASE